MKFQPGNKLADRKKSHRGGRPKSFTTQCNEAMAIIDQELPLIVMQLVEKAKEGDREALIYLIDRRMGKPKIQAEVDITGGEELGALFLLKMYQVLADERKRLYSGTDAPEVVDSTAVELITEGNGAGPEEETTKSVHYIEGD